MPSEAEPRSPSRANADDASADVAEGAMARRRASLDGKVLVGGEGQDYIAATLSRADDVAAAMERVRKHGPIGEMMEVYLKQLKDYRVYHR